MAPIKTTGQPDHQMAKKIAAAKLARQEGNRRTSSISAPDQYKDGIAASVWEAYIGEDRESRYKEWLVQTLRLHNCVKVLDVACGTGVDSRMLIEEGFKLTSCDLSDNMLDVARDTKKAKKYSDWVIRQADWMKLPTQLDDISPDFDAVICMGNSFAHLPDDLNKQEAQQKAIANFRSMLKPGGILIIDHRNFDYIIKNGRAPAQNIYYKSTWNCKVDTTLHRNSAKEVTSIVLDYAMTVPMEVQQKMRIDLDGDNDQVTFQLSYFPHYLEKFNSLLLRAFEYGANDTTAPHQIYGDFVPIEFAENPAYFIHVITKQENPLISNEADR